MATIRNIPYQIITNDIAAPISEGFGWTGTIYGVDIDLNPRNSFPTSVSATTGGLTLTFTPDAANGFKIYQSTTDSNHYTTFRSQNTDSQYPNTGYSLDIWSATLYDDIADITNLGITWLTITENSEYTLNPVKYSLFYNYAGPNAPMFVKGGKIKFSTPVIP